MWFFNFQNLVRSCQHIDGTPCTYLLFWFLVDRTVHFHYCFTLPIIRTVLKKQACNIYKYWSYNRNLRVSSFSTFDVTNCFCNDWQKKVDKEKVSIISGQFLEDLADKSLKQIILQDNTNNMFCKKTGNHSFK